MLLRYIVSILLPKKIAVRLPQKVLRRIYHNKKFSVRIGNKKTFTLIGTSNSLENSIYWKSLTKSDEGFSIELLIKLIKQEKNLVFWDVGANSGVFSILVKYMVPNATILAFEPSNLSCKKFKLNCDLNNFSYSKNTDSDFKTKNILIFENALSSNIKVSEFKYFSRVDNFTYGGKIVENNIGVLRTEKIQTITASEIISSDKNLLPNFIKIDIEGHEDHALRGFGDFLQELRVVLIEILDDVIAKKIETLLNSGMYRYFDVNDQTHRVVECDHLKQSISRNWFIVRRDQEIIINLLKSQNMAG